MRLFRITFASSSVATGPNALITQDTSPDGVYVTKGMPKLEHIDSLGFLGMIKH